jgi:hypothetical protein
MTALSRKLPYQAKPSNDPILEMKTATPKGSRLESGGQGQNRTADTRIFNAVSDCI